jgi:hypothetical protein
MSSALGSTGRCASCGMFLDRPVALVLSAQGAPTDRAAFERALA